MPFCARRTSPKSVRDPPEDPDQKQTHGAPCVDLDAQVASTLATCASRGAREREQVWPLRGTLFSRLPPGAAPPIQRACFLPPGAEPQGRRAEAGNHRAYASARAERPRYVRELAEQVRYTVARVYLEQDSRSLAEVAYLLGYADVRAFIRAYKRWTGNTPGTVRRADVAARTRNA